PIGLGLRPQKSNAKPSAGALFLNSRIHRDYKHKKGKDPQMSEGQPKPNVNAVRTFIEEELLAGRKENFDETTDLIAVGVIDSLSLLRLVSFLEENCQIQILDEEMVPGNFRTLAAIQSFIAQHQATRPPQSN